MYLSDVFVEFFLCAFFESNGAQKNGSKTVFVTWNFRGFLAPDSFRSWFCRSSRAFSFTLLLVCHHFCRYLLVMWRTLALFTCWWGKSEATDQPPNVNATGIHDMRESNRKQWTLIFHLILNMQPWDNKILQWTWRRTVWNVWHRFVWLRVELSPGGGNRKSRVQSHSTLPMPSSAETSTQQAVWTRGRLCARLHTSVLQLPSLPRL